VALGLCRASHRASIGLLGGRKEDEEQAAAPERALEPGRAMPKALQPPSPGASRFHRFPRAGGEW